jgi:hypothetical protein
MQFETGAQTNRGAGRPFPPIDPKYPDFPVQKWYDYGFKEGIQDDFGVPYAEPVSRRRMMSISTHNRISAIPGRVKLLEEFIKYAQKQKGVAFMRKDEIAKWALSASNIPHET